MPNYIFPGVYFQQGKQKSLIIDCLYSRVFEASSHIQDQFELNIPLEDQLTKDEIQSMKDNLLCKEFKQVPNFKQFDLSYSDDDKFETVIIQFNNVNNYINLLKALINTSFHFIIILENNNILVQEVADLLDVLKTSCRVLSVTLLDKHAIIKDPVKFSQNYSCLLRYKGINHVETQLINHHGCEISLSTNKVGLNYQIILPSIKLYREFLHRNVFFNQTLFIDVNGNFKRSFQEEIEFGNINDSIKSFHLEELLLYKDYKKYWNVKSEDIETVKDSSFRNITICSEIPKLVNEKWGYENLPNVFSLY